MAAGIALAATACTPRQQAASRVAGREALTATGWIDATATLDPATTPVYAGDAPMKFEFLKDMRKGDGFTLSAYSMGAHSGTHIDAPSRTKCIHRTAATRAADRTGASDRYRG
jgi:hypothetical protein